MTARQDTRTRCDCGGELRHAPTSSPWEFDAVCDTCGYAGTVSWAHAAAPPIFVPDSGRQGELF